MPTHYENHREEVLAQRAKRYADDPEFAAEKRRIAKEWYEAHKNEPKVKKRRATSSYRWKENHHEQHLAARRRRRQDSKAEKAERWAPLFAKAMASGCTLCPESNIKVLRFVHLDSATKSFDPHRHTALPANAPIEAEIRKCVVLCANCQARVKKGILLLPYVQLDLYWQGRLG